MYEKAKNLIENILNNMRKVIDLPYTFSKRFADKGNKAGMKFLLRRGSDKSFSDWLHVRAAGIVRPFSSKVVDFSKRMLLFLIFNERKIVIEMRINILIRYYHK